MNYLGYGTFALGVIIILFTFLLGYGIYVSVGNSATSYSPQQSFSGGGSLNDSITQITASLSQSVYALVRSSTYIVLEVVILFLFATVGYKIAKLGVDIINGPAIQKIEDKRGQR
ncbi:MAG: hypothetical protein KGH71_02375 [Candidatus Micrarchaeota archaeon]|nr:hypothetical protein [Candidatus Micrarchaeota archaeon]